MDRNLWGVPKDPLAWIGLRGSFLEFGKILPHPWEIWPSFLPRGRALDKKVARVAGIRSLKKFSLGLPGGMYPVGIDWDINL